MEHDVAPCRRGFHRPTRDFTISDTTAAAPPKARKDFEKGLALEKKERLAWRRAKISIRSHACIPSTPVAWGRTGSDANESEAGKWEAEAIPYTMALEADSHSFLPTRKWPKLPPVGKEWKDLAEVTDQVDRV